MQRKKRFTPGYRTRIALQTQEDLKNQKESLDQQYQAAEERAARKRQQSEEIKKRAVEEMAKQDENTAVLYDNSKKTPKSGVATDKSWLQTQSYVPNYNKNQYDTNAVQQSSSIINDKSWLNPPKMFDSATGKPIWAKDSTKDKLNDEQYYDNLKQTYLEDGSDNAWYNGWPTVSSVASKGFDVVSEAVKKTNWLGNTIGYLNQKKNETEMSTYLGQITMNQELRGHLQNVLDYQKMVSDLANAEQHLASNPNNQDIRAYVKDLRLQLPRMAQKAVVASTYLDSAANMPAQENASVPGAAFMPTGAMMRNTAKLGYQHTIEDLVKDLSASYSGRNIDINAINSIGAKLQQLGQSKTQKWDTEDVDSREGFYANKKELDEWKKWKTIDKDYLAKAEASARDLSFTDPNTYLYGLPGVLGSSASFNGLQWANTALSMTGGTLLNTGAGAIVGAPMVAAGFGLGILSGVRENQAEVYDAVSGVFLKKLQSTGLYDSFIKDASKKLGRQVDYEEALQAMAAGEYAPTEKIKKEFVNSTFGANNLFKHDMLAVTGDNILETTINIVPFGKFGVSALMKPTNKISKLRRLAAFKQAHPEIYGKTSQLIGNLSEAGYNAGATVSPVIGVGTALLASATKPLRNWAVNGVSELTTKVLSKKFGTIADWALKSPKKLLNTKAAGRYTKDWVGRVLGTSFAESIEEGKQYYNQKQFADGNYAGESDSVMDLILGDVEGGSKSALQFAGSFLGFTPDKEWIANMRGGFLAGAGHTAIQTGFANVRNALTEIKSNELVINNILATKLQERADIEKGRSYATRSSFADRKAMNIAFDNAKELQHQITARGKELGDPSIEGISDEAIEEQRQMYNRIFNIANDEHVRSAAKSRGIMPGSSRYATYVSLINFADQEAQRALEGITQKSNGIGQLINQTLFNADNVDALTDDQLIDIVNRDGIRFAHSKRPMLDTEAIEENRRNRRNAVGNVTRFVDYIAHLDALLSQRDQILLKDVKTKADERKLNSINKQIEALRNSVKDENGQDTELSKINSAAELQQYIYDIDLHEVIRDQYRDVTNYTIDFDNALAMQYNLAGERISNVQQMSDLQVLAMLDKLDSSLQRQYESRVAVTDNTDVNKTDTGFNVNNTELNEEASKLANKVIDDYLKSVKEDEQFEQEIHDDMMDAIEELYAQPQLNEQNAQEETAQQEKPVEQEQPAEQKEVVQQEEQAVKQPQKPQKEEVGTVEGTVKEKPSDERKTRLNRLVEQFPLQSIAEDQEDKVSDDTKQAMNSVVDDFNKVLNRIQKFDELDDSQKQQVEEDLYDVINRANDINEKIDAEIKLAESIDSEPQQQYVPIITNDDVIDAEGDTTKFDKTTIDDPTNWGIMTKTRWNRPGVGGGIEESVSEDNSIKLKDVIGDPEFIQNATFELIMQCGKKNDQPWVVVHYKGHSFSPIFIQTAQYQNWSRGYSFWSEIKKALSVKGENQMVVAGRVLRTTGKEKRTNQDGTPSSLKSLEQAGLINDSNMYTIEFSVDQQTIGITEVKEDAQGRKTIAVYTPSISGRGHQIIYEYSAGNHDDKPAAGLPIFLFDRHFSENGHRRTNVPINLMLTKINTGDAQLILEILRGDHTKDKNAHGSNILAQEYVQEDGRGNLIKYGITNKEVLEFLIRYGYKYPEDRRHIHLEFNDEDNRFVRLVGFVDGESQNQEEIPIEEFNIFDEIGSQNFLSRLDGRINRAFNQTYARSRVGDQFADANSNPFVRLNSERARSLALKKMLENGGKIKFGDSSIEFDMKDFVDQNNPNSVGVSGIVWYARHGFLQTHFNGFDYTLLVFDEDAGVNIVDRPTVSNKPFEDAVIDENEAIQEAQIEEQAIKDETKVDVSQVDKEKPKATNTNKRKNVVLLDDDELAKKEKSLPKESDRVSVEEGRKHILDILGDKYFAINEIYKDATVEQMINMFKNGEVALAYCKESFIALSKFMRRGTEYHEAFHRVAELLMSDKERNRLYNSYAKAKHIKIYDSNGKPIAANMKKVTEGVADEFAMFMIDRPTIKLSWNLKLLLNSIKNWIKFYNKIGSYKLYKIYHDVNSGKYKNVQPTEANKKRFAELLNMYKTDALFFKINDTVFKNITSVRQYKNLCNSMLYIIYQSKQNIDNVDGIRESKIFKKYAQVNPALNDLIENWDVVKKDIKTLSKQILVEYTGANDNEDNVEDMQGDEESVAGAGIEQWVKDSSEFSQFSRATDKVKHFFATIPAAKYVYDQDGVKRKQAIVNAEGLPYFVKATTMYNIVLNQVYNCRSLSELIDKLKTSGQENLQFNIIYNRIVALRDSADKGNVEDATLLTQLCVNLHASKGEYIICKAVKTKNNKFDLIIQPTDSDYAAKNYRTEWSKLFAGGASKYLTTDADGNYVMKNGFKPSVFTILSQFMLDFKRAVSPVGISDPKFNIVVKDESGNIVQKAIDVTNPEDLAIAKSKLIAILNNLGIVFNVDMLNYMLNTKYGKQDYTALNRLFTEDSKSDISAFAMFIRGFNNNGKLNVERSETGWYINASDINKVFNGRGCGFVGLLSNWAYNYKKSQDQLSILANKQNRRYLISENNYLTDSIDEMNASIDGDMSKIDDLKSFVYNWYQKDGQFAGSIILKNYSGSNPNKLKIVTDLGFKTDQKGDIGEDYTEISQSQDEVSKIEMLLRGKIILPTMSDKKTWGYIDGLQLPGLNIESSLTGQFINQVQVNKHGGYLFSQNQQILDQLREYAMLEYYAVVQTLRDVKGYTDPETGEVYSPMKEADKIKNYHTATVRVKGRPYKIIQGARFSTLYAIYDSKGRKISFNRVCDESGKFISEEDNIATAMKYFYGVPSDTEGMYYVYNAQGEYVEVDEDQLADIQRQIISRSLQLQLRKQMQKAETLGLIEKVTDDKSIPLVYRYKNKLLSSSVVNKIKSEIKQDLNDQQKESLAIAIIMNDVSCKSIISLQETERIFSGHPSFYKWQYNKKGILSDRSTDQHKRFGGLVSTGQNNAFVFKGLPTTYKAAEINDVEVQSEHVETIQRLMYEGEIRSSYIKQELSKLGLTMEDSNTNKAIQIAKDADEKPLEEIEQLLDPIVLAVAKRKAKQKSDSFRKSKEEHLDGINVADGATYITDKMCEILLKQVGSYGEDVQRAFKVLRGEEVDGRVYTAKDVREMLTAYELIRTSVIGTQKYTAYGFRKQNGVLVPYYNKTALFPLFKSLCTGKTAQLLDKMTKEEVDMVMLNSAVKVGSQGSQDLVWENFDTDFHFNTYTQEYKYLRKQLNTDPKEEVIMHMGTQMTKIIMSSILPGRNYYITDQDGKQRTLNAIDFVDDIMTCIRKLSEIGYIKLKNQLFNDNGQLDVQKFSDFLVDELSSRGASRDLIDAVTVVDKDSNIDEYRKKLLESSNKKELKVPLSALSGMNWIQSIIASKINKTVIDINTPGAAFIQRSILGMEGTTMVGEDEVPDLYEGRKLMFRNEEGSMDCVLSIDFFKNIIPPNLSFQEAKQWLIDNKIISGRMSSGEWNDASAQIIGYRIPTQAQSSIHALRVVDVLPVVNDTIVLPTEFTKITGSDKHQCSNVKKFL